MMRARTLFVIAIVTTLVGLPGEAAAKKLEDTFIRIEINDTDGDAGIHVFLDGEGWDTIQMVGPGGEVMFSVAAEGSVGMQGLTELFFESAEPSFDVQPLEELLELFPAGKYRFRGTTKEGRKLKGNARLNHRIPDAPVQVFPLEDDEVDPSAAVLEWMPVADPAGGEIVGYEVIVECENDDTETEFFAQVEADVTTMTVPPEFLSLDDAECKWEVLSIEDGGNQTISESDFEIE